MPKANLSGAALRKTVLIGAVLRNADLSGANLSGANLAGSNLSGTNLNQDYMIGAILYTPPCLTAAYSITVVSSKMEEKSKV